MGQEALALGAKELQRVTMIASCMQGDLACASAAKLFAHRISPSQNIILRLKPRYHAPQAVHKLRAYTLVEKPT